MRVTGAADPLKPVSETLKGKLPQRKIVTTAANGYSSYGNQIGLATGQVDELYHDGYVAKRMEIGAVIAAAPAENVRRERPVDSDVVILLGGKTGRDGCGGATAVSYTHLDIEPGEIVIFEKNGIRTITCLLYTSNKRYESFYGRYDNC